MQYLSYSYLFPPRPGDNKQPGDMLKAIDAGLSVYAGWVPQTKKNGTCNVMASAPDRTVKCMTRHKSAHKAWRPDAKTGDVFRRLPGTGWYVVVAELMHSKVDGMRNVNYINDVLVANGEYLVGTTFDTRQRMMLDMFLSAYPDAVETPTHWILDECTWLAKPLAIGGLHKMFMSFAPKSRGMSGGRRDFGNFENEGFVLKNPKGKLALCSKENSNTNWLVKFRHETTSNPF